MSNTREVYIVWFDPRDSYNSRRALKTIAVSPKDAKEWIALEVAGLLSPTGRSSYARESVDWWLKNGFSIEPFVLIDMETTCSNPECPRAGYCGGHCVNKF